MTQQGKLNSDITLEKTSDTDRLLCPGQSQNPNPDEPDIFSFLIKKLLLSEFRSLLKLVFFYSDF